MKQLLLFAPALLLAAANCHGQGGFNFNNVYAPTRIGSIDGPLAGTGIWAQVLAGASPDSLAPVGRPAEHVDRAGLPTGLVFGGTVAVPGVLPCQTAYVEMLAWDGTRWG